MINNTLALFQLCDSNFPTGSFSQSFGLETYIQQDIVHDAESFVNWLDVYVNEQLTHADGLAAKLVYEALEEDNMGKIWEIDQLLRVQNLARESREGTVRMGARMLDIAESIYEFDLLTTYRERLRNKQASGHPAIVFSMVGYKLKVDKRTTILYYLYSTIVGLVQNAVRAIPLGQTAGQKIINTFQEKLQTAANKVIRLEESEFGIVSPGLELAQMQHERVGVRIFSS